MAQTEMTAEIAAETKAAPQRRSQEERTREMRTKLLDATIICLEREGYAATSISRIVAEARVSRGAHLHHFESKAALIQAAAERLMLAIFKRLGRVSRSVRKDEDRLASLIRSLWKDVFQSRDGAVVLELMIAARTDRELAERLHGLMAKVRDLYALAAQHYFQSKPGAPMAVEDIFFLTQWQLRGMLLDKAIVRDPTVFDAYIDKWIALIGAYIEPRRGVEGPPPKPEWWPLEA
ncbi:MAG: TetR/AcrR family transcriptional regulator [Sphingomonadales bacterium]